MSFELQNHQGNTLLLTNEKFQPLSIRQNGSTIFEPFSTTLEGTEFIIENTYNDQIDLLKVYGMSMQTVTEQGDNLCPTDWNAWTLSDGASIDEDDWLVLDSNNYAYTASATITFSIPPTIPNDINFMISVESENMNEDTSYTIEKWYAVARYYDSNGTQITTETGVSSNGMTTTLGNRGGNNWWGGGFIDTCEKVKITFQTNSSYSSPYYRIRNPVFALATVITSVNWYEPFSPDSPSADYPSEITGINGAVTVCSLDENQQTALTVPSLYSIGNVCDILYVNRAQKQSWIERYIASGLLTDTVPVNEQTDAILATPTIEELEYTPLPTFPQKTYINFSGDVAPTMEITLRQYK